MRSPVYLATCALGLGLAAYTQLAHLTAVPGLHFDEAWQGLFAHRIATEPGFYPLSAMNSYTTPVVHYLLAGVFKVFGPTLEAMRGAYAALNLGSLVLITALLLRLGELGAAAWFSLLWGLLPLSVHNHRFYVEVTGFHGLCLSVALWGIALWRQRPKLSFALTLLPLVAGTYSHILFVSVFAAGFFALARSFSAEFRGARARALCATTALLLAPLPIRMGIGLGKALPFVLALALLSVACWAVLAPHSALMARLWEKWPRRAMRLSRAVFFACIPFLLGFAVLAWNGFWPYAQATGRLQLAWLPINLAMLALALFFQLYRRRPHLSEALASAPRAPRARYALSPGLLWSGFIATFLITSLLILKQAPRYYTVPFMLCMIWVSLRMARLPWRPWAQAALAGSFIVWNLTMFHVAYLTPFHQAGSTTREFKLAFYHDNGRDFRPFQKLYQWGLETGCLAEVPWVEDDRFKLPFDFLRLTSGPPRDRANCPHDPADIFFSHIPDYDPALNGQRNEHNTPHPPAAPNVKFLAHSADWGDLAVYIRRIPLQELLRNNK